MWIRTVGVMRGAHQGRSTACAHGRALGIPTAWLCSSLRSTRHSAAARWWPAVPCRSCSCRRAHSALHGTGCLCSCTPRVRRPSGGGRMRSRTAWVQGRRDGREPHYVGGLLAADCAEESLADRQLGFTTLDDRRIWTWHLGVAYDT
jgi:hypothetical protein